MRFFFAIEDASINDVCSIWAIDFDWMRRNARALMPRRLKEKTQTSSKEQEIIREIFELDKLFVWPVNPLRFNKRLAAQQGVFVCARDISRPFMENLESICNINDSKSHMLKIDIDCKERFLKQALLELHRMNINRRTLFPSLEGFSQDLKNRFVMGPTFRYVKKKNETIWTMK